MDLDNLSSATNHNGGAIHFGPDGKLYVAVGDNANSANSQSLSNVLGKMLRINPDGTIPADNPYVNQTNGINEAIWATGLRNPFTFAFQPGTGRMFINDVGQSAWKRSTKAWPAAITAGSRRKVRRAILNTSHRCTTTRTRTRSSAQSRAAFYAPEVRQFPSAYLDSYFFSDLCGGWIRRSTRPEQSNGFATGISAPVDLLAGHDGSLYTMRGGGVLRRVRWNQHLEGDVNGDGATTNADAFYLMHHFYGGGPAPVQGGDVDNNGILDPNDLTYLVTYLLGRGPTPV
jgi:glucose/arabinose dehydrogenase